jgi:small subunit ribosomal protein S21
MLDMHGIRRVKYSVSYKDCEDDVIMANVKLGTGESFDSLLRRFNRRVQEDRILAEVRRRRFYEKPSEQRKKKEAAKRRKSSRGLR